MSRAERTLMRLVDEACRAYDLFAPDDCILVALSGGADSVALLLSLKTMYPGLHLVACHVNHRLRPGEAERDAAFAEALCTRWGIPFELCEADVATLAESEHISTELAARWVRYAFFEEQCRKHGLHKLATAHTASDNAETVLFNLTRGSALAGLAGIPPKRELAENITLIRPLILVSRERVEAYLAALGQDYVTDSTNLTDAYTRNFLRHRVMPLLKQINPSLEERFGGMCRSLRETQIFIEKTANNSLTDEITALARLDEPVLCQCILQLYRRSFSDTPENVHIRAVAALVRESARTGKNAEVCFPGGTGARIEQGRLFFAPTVRKERQTEVPYRLPLRKGFYCIPDTPFAVEYTEASDSYALPTHDGFTLFDSVLCDSSLLENGCIRSRRPGDTVRSGGITRKLKELFNKKKIPTELRAVLPLLCVGNVGEMVVYAPRTALCDTQCDALKRSPTLYRFAVYKKD